MNYLVIGSGGREHCLSWRLLKDGSAKTVYNMTGNGGTLQDYNYSYNSFDDIEKFCISKNIDCVVIGPEAPLVDGLSDYLNIKNIPVFGPSRKAAELEGSKLFTKYILEKYNIPTAGHIDFTSKDKLIQHINSIESFPIVIKLDGLAAGKGVCVPTTKEDALLFVNEMVKDGAKVFIEDYLTGEEASVLGISDGERVYALVPAQDHKRAYDNDQGPNTGGMGAYAPTPVLNSDQLDYIEKNILQKVVDGMKNEGRPFKGVLYAGVMIDGDKINVLEFNVRFGDPETQVVLPLLDCRLGDIIQASITGNMRKDVIKFKNETAITVVIAAGGYPGSYNKNIDIAGLENLSDKVTAFHAGTVINNGRLLTNGGRILSLTAVGTSLKAAHDLVYSEIDKIKIAGSFYRKDIGHKAMK